MAQEKLRTVLQQSDIQSWRLLMETFRTVYNRLEKTLTDEGASASRFQVLFYLYFEGPKRATELSRKLLVTRGNMTMFLRRMESDRLIKYQFEENQKRPVIHLTDKGIKFFEDLFPRHTDRVSTLVKPFSRQTRKDLEALLERAQRAKLK